MFQRVGALAEYGLSELALDLMAATGVFRLTADRAEGLLDRLTLLAEWQPKIAAARRPDEGEASPPPAVARELTGRRR